MAIVHIHDLNCAFSPEEVIIEHQETALVESTETTQEDTTNQEVTQQEVPTQQEVTQQEVTQLEQYFILTQDSTILTPTVTLTSDPKKKVTQRKLKVIKENLYDEVQYEHGGICMQYRRLLGNCFVFY